VSGSGPAPLAVVVVSWNTRDLLRSCLASLRAEADALSLDVWVVDNASEDGSAEMVEAEFPEARLLRTGENVGFAAANNRALRRIDAPFVLLLNPDTEVREGALERALEAARDRTTTVAARLLNPDGSLQHSCFRFPRLGVDLLEALYLHLLLPRRIRGPLLLGGHWSHDEAREVDWALGAFLLVPGTAVEDAGLLPEEYPLFGEDIEWCWRLGRAGYPVRYCPDAEVVHHGNQAAGRRPPEWRIRRTHATKYLFCRRHYGPVRALLHRGVDLLGYTVRAVLFTLLGLVSRRRRAQAGEYRRILRVLLGPGGPEEEGP